MDRQFESKQMFENIPLNKSDVCQQALNIEQKNRSNLFPWNGQFSPQLVETLLSNYAPANARVFDPFMGSGTVLVECASKGLSSTGTEINPAAFQFALSYKLCNLSKAKREELIDSVEEILIPLIDGEVTLFTRHRAATNKTVEEALIDSYQQISGDFAGVILKTLLLLLDFKAKPLDRNRLQIVWKRLRAVILELPFSKSLLDPRNLDARKTSLPVSHFDLVITSPPYINVFNYHQNYRATAEEFGHDLLQVARSEIGSNRKHRGNRFLTVIQYILDMSEIFTELRRVCKDDARVIFVVGRESNVRKTRFMNGEIITNIATRCCGFEAILRQERVFTNRFGAKIFEDILHFKPMRNMTGHQENPYEIAREVLESAMNYVTSEPLADLKKAIDGLREVQASPYFNPEKIGKN